MSCQSSGPLSVAVVGAGRWGKNLIRVFGTTDRCRVAAICDTAAARLAGHRAHPTARLFRNVENALGETCVDAVVIATPAPSHFALAAACLKRGKHVFVEKPMTLSSADSAALVVMARRSRRKLMVGHVLRYHPAVVELGSLVANGRLGTIREIRSERRGPPVECADGLWWTVSPHDVSLARWLFRDDPFSVVATHSHPSPGGERTEARLSYSGNRVALIVAASSTDQRGRRIEVAGTRGFAVLEDSPSSTSLTFWEGAGTAFLGSGEPISIAQREPLAVEADHFVRAVLDGGSIATDAEEGHSVVETLEAGSTSMSLGGIVCQIGLRAPRHPATSPGP